MKKIPLISLLAGFTLSLPMALPGLARAGDLALPPLVTKAPPMPSCSLAGCTGPVLGLTIGGSGTGVNVINLGALNANGTYMGITGGYQFFNGTYWLGSRFDVSYAVAQPNSDIVGAGFSNKLFAFEGAEFGGPISAIFGLPPLNLPGPLANAVPTILVGACQNGNSLKGYCAGAAAHFFVPNSKFTVDAVYLNAQYGRTSIAPGMIASTENRGTFGFSYHF